MIVKPLPYRSIAQFTLMATISNITNYVIYKYFMSRSFYARIYGLVFRNPKGYLPRLLVPGVSGGL